jgi:hypothetical protein
MQRRFAGARVCMNDPDIIHFMVFEAILKIKYLAKSCPRLFAATSVI